MKYFTTVLFMALLCQNLIEAQSPNYTDIPGPENVLVVFKSPTDQTDTVSQTIANYYKTRRDIPDINIIGLENLIDADIYDPESGTTHSIELTQQGEIIKDINNQSLSTPTIHAWRYFNERIAIPVANYLKTHYVNGTPLKDIIRFIVLCKGVPFRIDSRIEDADSKMQNVICANLLCLLGETMEDEDALLFYYDKQVSVPNPYYRADPNFTMSQNFLPNHYQTSVIIGGQTRIITLSYLVTHLSAPRLSDVLGMIDRSLNAINETNYNWFIDADPTPCRGWSPIGATTSIFSALGINNYFFDNSETAITSYNNRSMSYSSNGTWTSIGEGCDIMPFNGNYIQTLDFDYADGAYFSSIESHNGLSIGTYPVIRTRGQGLIADFTLMGGTVATGQAFHSPESHIIANEDFFPNYTLGYSFIESSYLGMIYLNATNVIVGDPLTRIAYPCEPLVLTVNTTLSSGNYDCGIIVPEGITLTIANSSVINFLRNASLKIYGTIELENNVSLNFNGFSKLYVYNTGALITSTSSIITFNDNSFYQMDESQQLEDDDNLVFNDNSELLLNGQLIINGSDGLVFNNNSSVDVKGKLTLISESILNFNDESQIQISGSLITQGTESDKVELNFESNDNEIGFNNGDSLILDYTIINNGGLAVRNTSAENQLKVLRVTNSLFNNPYRGLSIYLNGNETASIPEISSCNINFVGPINYQPIAVDLQQIPEIIFDENAISFSSVTSIGGINLFNNGQITISGCTISGSSTGINSKISIDQESPPIESLESEILISECTIDHCSTGILIDNQNAPYASVQILNNNIDNCLTAISVNQFNGFSPVISDNKITDFTAYGISLTNGNSATVQSDSIVATVSGILSPTGIYLSQVTNPYLLENYISTSLSNPGSGIVSVSSSGNYRLNEISGFYYGIDLGNSSSPNVAQNEIHNNKNYGIYISTGSNPKLNKGVSGGLTYPISGYNNIYENGIGGPLIGDPEIYINTANIQLSKGCNTIADDRYNPPNYNHKILIDGIHVQSSILADSNYWGNHPVYGHDPAQRFGSGVSIRYIPYDTVPCTYSPGSSDMLLLKTTTGSTVDTLYADGTLVGQLSQIESAYSDANNNFYSGNLSAAETIYKQIIAGSEDSSYSLDAYSKLYLIKKYQNDNAQGYENLRQYYSGKLSAVTDSGIFLALTNLINMCSVSKEEYEQAIDNFDQAVINNQGTDIALYNQINALTTALLVDTTNGLGKSRLTKYRSSNITQYLDNVNQLLKNRGKDIENNEEKIIPTEYHLYQNYPNPFNPVTTIKYAIPKAVNVELKVFNILGQEVKTLVNESRNPGYYEVQFNAGNFASGVYLYRLKAGEYIKTGKMMLLK